jgi:hypothetical protein
MEWGGALSRYFVVKSSRYVIFCVIYENEVEFKIKRINLVNVQPNKNKKQNHVFGVFLDHKLPKMCGKISRITEYISIGSVHNLVTKIWKIGTKLQKQSL